MSKVFLGNFEKVNDTKWIVGLVHYCPFDTEAGLGKTETQLNQVGLLVEQSVIPEPIMQINKKARLLYNSISSSLYYEYTDVPLSGEQELQLLKDKVLLMQGVIDELLMGGA